MANKAKAVKKAGKKKAVRAGKTAPKKVAAKSPG
jgi:hypothetical protein